MEQILEAPRQSPTDQPADFILFSVALSFFSDVHGILLGHFPAG
jgi:hypothetical protein